MTKKTDNRIVSPADETELERLLYQACRAGGWLFATTERDVAEEEQRQAAESIDVPDELRDPSNVWQRASQLTEDRKLTPVIDERTKENLARAARGGTSLPKDIEERMHQDREKAEKESGH